MPFKLILQYLFGCVSSVALNLGPPLLNGVAQSLVHCVPGQCIHKWLGREGYALTDVSHWSGACCSNTCQLCGGHLSQLCRPSVHTQPVVVHVGEGGCQVCHASDLKPPVARCLCNYMPAQGWLVSVTRYLFVCVARMSPPSLPHTWVVHLPLSLPPSFSPN